MNRIGITGGIGSGKTTISRLFTMLGVAVYNADDRAKYLMSHHVALKAAIIAVFGAEAYTEQGLLNRAFLSAKVFNNAEALIQLNGLVHPVVFSDFDDWCLKQQGPYILKEAALVYETILHQKLDKIIVVTAPEELKIKRLQKRDASTVEQIQQRMKAQMSESEKLKLADFVIYNDEQQAVIPQVIKLHELLSQ